MCLIPVELTADLMDSGELDGFEFGTEDWEAEIRDNFRGSRDKLGSIRSELQSGTSKFWVFKNSSNEIVGYGAAGNSFASFPKNSSPRPNCTCITWLAVDVRFRNRGYGKKILQFLLDYAVSRASTHPLISLFVDSRNHPAIQLYQNHHFIQIGKPVPQAKLKTDEYYLRLVRQAIASEQ